MLLKKYFIILLGSGPGSLRFYTMEQKEACNGWAFCIVQQLSRNYVGSVEVNSSLPLFRMTKRPDVPVGVKEHKPRRVQKT
jgi:hypothetical protein